MFFSFPFATKLCARLLSCFPCQQRTLSLERSILQTLAESGELNSLQIQDALCQRFHYCFLPVSTVFYNGLRQLESQGMIISRMSETKADCRRGNRRKYYRLNLPLHAVDTNRQPLLYGTSNRTLSPVFVLN